ncbi:MAG TPA: DUF1565 domain-containing protein [Gemmatimonadota bacterium]|jgi:hypothetical protein
MTSFQTTRRLRLLASGVLLLAGACRSPVDPEPAASGAPALAATAVTYHVATNGRDRNPGTLARPFKTVAKAVGVVRPGDVILVHAGTYTGAVRITRSGTQSQPITLAWAGDGPVTLRANLAAIPCSASQPTRERTIQILEGADDWTIRGLTIVGGVYIEGTNIGRLNDHLRDRSLPGRSSFDPSAYPRVLPLLGSDGADRIILLNNRIQGRGVFALASRFGRIINNEISNIDCGTGGGIGLGRFSDGWTIRGNHVHHLTASTRHHMSEGIRHVAASSYGLVEGNTVEDVGGLSRGITADVNASWTTFRNNVVRRAHQGFNEQSGGWGNRWIGNVAEGNRHYAFNVYGQGENDPQPHERTPAFLVVECNRATGHVADLNIGGVQRSAFSNNSFGAVRLGAPVPSYWAAAGNTWNGTSQLPPANPPPVSCS